MPNTLWSIVATAALAWPAGAMAHTSEELAARLGAHGGRLQATGQYHVELLVGPGQVQVWVTDHADRAQPTEGATATAMLVYPGATVAVPLQPAGENRLAASDARLKAGVDARVSLVLTMKGQAPAQARFVLAPAGAAKPKSGAHSPHSH